jgi:hypothetical protein
VKSMSSTEPPSMFACYALAEVRAGGEEQGESK